MNTKNPFLFLLFCSMLGFGQLANITYNDGTQKLVGLALKPKKTLKDLPGILILPAWKGIDARAKTSAQELSELGYHTLIADIYGEGNYPKNSAEAGQISGSYKKNRDQYRNRIRLALNELIKLGANPDKIVVIGYCFGGTGVLEAARAGMPVKGVVAFHGGLSKGENSTTTTISTKVLVCHGADDPYVPQEEVLNFQQEMRDAKADWQMIYYANSVHAFTDKDAGNDNTKGAAYNEKSEKRSWEHLLIFLKEVL